MVSMPLPDERPRSSVANLIGRFEKGQSSVPPVPAPTWRSSSVASHITGDSVKEEAKEKREWPPRSVTEANTPSAQQHAAPTPPVEVVPPTPIADTPQSPLDIVAEEPVPTLPPAESAPKQNGGEISKNGSGPPRTSATAKHSTTVSAIPPKAPVTKQATVPTQAKTPVKSQATPPSPKTAPHPTKPQHAAPPVSSSTPVAKKVTPKSTPVAPARTKTPIRAKTPITSSRPKTPSSRLYAPTASSLARSLSNTSETPTPTRKTTLSTSSPDRLSKPTAASLQKIRSPAPPSSPPKTTPVKSGLATKGVVKSASNTPLRKTVSDAKRVASAMAAGGASAAVMVAAIPTNDESAGMNGKHGEHQVEHKLEVAALDIPRVDASPSPQGSEGDYKEPKTLLNADPGPQHSLEGPSNDELQSAADASNASGHVVGNDIEEIVNLLESNPRRSVLVPNAEDVTEIPDED